MAFAQIQWSSLVLGKQTGLNIFFPEVGSGPFPTLYLLHGLTDDHTSWQRRSRVEYYVRELPLIVVMPDGGRGFYTDQENGPAYARHIGEELPAFVERLLPAKKHRAARCISGLSMGGYGAMRIGLGYPERFASVHSHSGALCAGESGSRGLSPAENLRVFGANPAGSNHDLLVLAGRAKAAGTLPQIRIDCGTDDFLLEDSRSVHARLDHLGVPHEYAEYPGAHDWDYWDLHIREAIAFHWRVVGAK